MSTALRNVRVITVPADTEFVVGDGEDWLSASQVKRALGNISEMALWRRARQPGLFFGVAFPEPVARVAGRRYWRRADIVAYKAALVLAAAKTDANKNDPPRRRRRNAATKSDAA